MNPDNDGLEKKANSGTLVPSSSSSGAVVLSGPTQTLSEFMSLEESYDTWRYGDEASLYSIAEDSREERTSEIASRCGDVDGVGFDDHPDLQPSANVTKNSVLEVTWSHDDEETRFSDSDGVISPWYDPSAASKGRRRRRILWAMLILLFVSLVITLAVVLSRDSNNNQENRPSASNTVQENLNSRPQKNETLDGSSAETSNDTGENPAEGSASGGSGSSAPPTAPPTAADNPALVRAFVTSALATCTDTSLLADESSLQSLAYRELLRQVSAASTVNSEGYLDIPKSIGDSSLAESFGLMMLYYSTSGEQWDQSDNWLVPEKPVCEWQGVVGCEKTKDGSCQIFELFLGESTLSLLALAWRIILIFSTVCCLVWYSQ
jgi:hypothetical protein